MIDFDLYQPTVEALNWLADLLVDGAVIGFDDWSYSIYHGETAGFLNGQIRIPAITLNSRLSLLGGCTFELEDSTSLRSTELMAIESHLHKQ